MLNQVFLTPPNPFPKLCLLFLLLFHVAEVSEAQLFPMPGTAEPGNSSSSISVPVPCWGQPPPGQQLLSSCPYLPMTLLSVGYSKA